MRRLLPLLLLAGVAFAVAACGGDDDSSGSGGGLTQEEWVAAADAICAETTAGVDALPDPQSPEEIGEYFDELTAISQGSVDELRALGPPPELADRFDQALEVLEQQAQIVRDAAELAADGDFAGMEEALASIEPVAKEADEIAIEIGLTECGSSDSGT
jgi:hypothetical protein